MASGEDKYCEEDDDYYDYDGLFDDASSEDDPPDDDGECYESCLLYTSDAADE